MKIGFNMLLWTAHVQLEHWPVLEDLKRTGYDGVEIPIFEGEPAHYAELGRHLRQLGLDSTGIALFPSVDMNPIGETPEQRAAALKHIEWVIECTAAMGAKMVGGPLHSTLGHFSGEAPTEEERRRGIAFHQAAGEMARARGVTIVVEAINRFECLFSDDDGRPRRLPRRGGASERLRHVRYVSRQHRGKTPHRGDRRRSVAISRTCIFPKMIAARRGAGHIDFAAAFRALKGSGYDGWLTIEAFGRALPPLAAATRVWRDFFPTPTQVYREGYAVIRNGWDAV